MELHLSADVLHELGLTDKANGQQVVDAIAAHPGGIKAAARSGAVANTATTQPVTPAVRAAAARAGVDVSTVTGTGVGGRVTHSDVTAAVSSWRPTSNSGVSTAPSAAASAPDDAALAAYAAQLGISADDLRDGAQR